ncbi:sulfhydrogenase subunit delta [Marinobacterium sp. CAU 1594]|nr:sulfhydrogenase subunit delta [Marinobacterium arenosum]
MTDKPRVAVHKFSSCDGCQLAFLNMGDDLLTLLAQLEVVHFAEMGVVDETAEADIAFVEGSVFTAHDRERIQRIRRQSRYLITIGACATSGGVQALRNYADDGADWCQAIYASPQYIDSLATSTPIRQHVKVDFELWGCPINSRQLVALFNALLRGVKPAEQSEKVCLECKRNLNVCTLVASGQPCLGAVTRAGCGALCPRFGRDCYGCYGPSELPNAASLGRWFEGIGLSRAASRRRFKLIHSTAFEAQHRKEADDGAQS